MLISAGASLEKEETSLNMNTVNYKLEINAQFNNNLSSITKGPFPPQPPKGN